MLAAGFGFTSGRNFFRAAYVRLFVFGIVENFPVETANHGGAALSAIASTQASPPAPVIPAGLWDWISVHSALTSLLAVGLVQATERFVWHVVLSRLFPDWLKD